MNSHSELYEAAQIVPIEGAIEQPEWYVLSVGGDDVHVGTGAECEQYAIDHFSFTKDQFNKLCDRGWAQTADGRFAQIEMVDGEEARSGD